MHPPRACARRSLPSTTLSLRSSSSSCSRLPLLVAAASALVVSLWPRSCRSAFSPPALHIPIRRRACTPDGALLSLSLQSHLASSAPHPPRHIQSLCSAPRSCCSTAAVALRLAAAASLLRLASIRPLACAIRLALRIAAEAEPVLASSPGSCSRNLRLCALQVLPQVHRVSPSLSRAFLARRHGALHRHGAPGVGLGSARLRCLDGATAAAAARRHTCPQGAIGRRARHARRALLGRHARLLWWTYCQRGV